MEEGGGTQDGLAQTLLARRRAFPQYDDPSYIGWASRNSFALGTLLTQTLTFIVYCASADDSSGTRTLSTAGLAVIFLLQVLQAAVLIVSVLGLSRRLVSFGVTGVSGLSAWIHYCCVILAFGGLYASLHSALRVGFRAVSPDVSFGAPQPPASDMIGFIYFR